jgi:hypothetical protein
LPKLVKSIRTAIHRFEEKYQVFTIDGKRFEQILDDYGRSELDEAQKTKVEQVCFAQ